MADTNAMIMEQEEDSPLLVEKKDGILIITINRPDRMNSLDRKTLHKGADLIYRIHYEKDVRVVIITGAGEKSFCAGADLKERATMNNMEVRNYILRIKNTLSSLENLNKPVIAAINGVALGGGLEFALACDIRIASPNARLGLTETSLGIIPGAGGTQRLPRLIGRGIAKELIFTAKVIDAETALKIGLINHIAPEGKLMEKAFEIAELIKANGPLAIEQAKIAVNRGMETDIDTGLKVETDAYEKLIPTWDRIEALAAFREKRKPEFRGE
jgi:methylglutaconyl-CoA hydratase